MTTTESMFDEVPAAGGDRFRNDEHEGRLLVLKIKGTELGVETSSGVSDVIVADVTIVDGPDAGETFDDAWLFGRVLFGQLKRRVGRTLCGRIGKGQAQKGKTAPWVLEPATPDETTLATRFMTERMRPPAPTGASSAPAEGPEPTDLGDTPPWERKS